MKWFFMADKSSEWVSERHISLTDQISKDFLVGNLMLHDY